MTWTVDIRPSMVVTVPIESGFRMKQYNNEFIVTSVVPGTIYPRINDIITTIDGKDITVSDMEAHNTGTWTSSREIGIGERVISTNAAAHSKGVLLHMKERNSAMFRLMDYSGVAAKYGEDFLKQLSPPQGKNVVMSTTTTATKQPAEAPPPVAATAAAAATKKRKPTKVKASSKPHALLWICAAGKGRGNTWKQKALKVVGVYSDKAAGEEKKREVMDQHDCCGHGDILVGRTWEDEIDLVVRPVVGEMTKQASSKKPHALLWICAAGKGRGSTWKQSALKVMGVYFDKAAAEQKKREIMEEHECCGHGDIMVGGTWEDEIDLVVRAVGEMST